jgi:hypothetical protein
MKKMFFPFVLCLIATGCSSIPSEVRPFMPEVSYGVKTNSDPFGLVSYALQTVQTAVGQPCPTVNANSTYRNRSDKGIVYKVDCTQ